MAETTDQKLDTQTSLLKWILGGVGTSVVGVAVWIGSFINSAMSHRDEGEKYLRTEVKASLDSYKKAVEDNGDTQATIVRVLEQQTKILGEIRDDQKKFPAVASGIP